MPLPDVASESKGTRWELRMIGGPYDGWVVPFTGERPPHSEIFLGLPYAMENSIPLRIPADAPITIPQAQVGIEYRLMMRYEDMHRRIAVYTYYYGKARSA
jgi:hypothetical protein